MRPIGLALSTALAVALGSPIAFASPLNAVALAHYDLSQQLGLRLFGETSDSGAAFAAAYGDRTSESPLRDLALPVVSRAPQATEFVPNVALAPTFARVDGLPAAQALSMDLSQGLGDRTARVSASFAPPSPLQSDDTVSVVHGDPAQAPDASSFTAGEYQPEGALPVISPGPGAFSFGPMAHAADGTMQSGFSSNTVPGASGSSVYTPASVRVGHVQFEGDVEGGSLQVPQASLHDAAYGAGANFNVRAGKRNVDLNLSSGYEQVTRNDTSTASAPALGNSSWELPGADGPLLIPNYAQMNKLSVAAGVAVPVVNGVTLNLNYDAQRLYGGYGMPGLTNLDAIGNSYGGRVTFQIPHSSSTLSISAAQYHYQDNILPLNSTTQTRTDVNFMVKF